METHTKHIWIAASELEMLLVQADQARAGLVQALCEAMAARMPAAAAADAAGLSVAELFDTLRSQAAAMHRAPW